MKFKISIYTIILILNVIFFTRCTVTTHTTIIRSNPSGAKLFINDKDVGYTPYKFIDPSQRYNNVKLKLVKEGYETFETSIKKDEALVPSSLRYLSRNSVTTPKFTYNPEHVYDLKKTTINGEKNPSKADRIREFKKLLDEKVITQEEFDKEKQKILNEK